MKTSYWKGKLFITIYNSYWQCINTSVSGGLHLREGLSPRSLNLSPVRLKPDRVTTFNWSSLRPVMKPGWSVQFCAVNWFTVEVWAVPICSSLKLVLYQWKLTDKCSSVQWSGSKCDDKFSAVPQKNSCCSVCTSSLKLQSVCALWSWLLKCQLTRTKCLDLSDHLVTVPFMPPWERNWISM